ncbi:MAG: site-specific integrase [archaeon]
MKESRLEIYPDRHKAYGKELKLLKAEKISLRNKELITEFHNYVFSTGSGELRVAKLSAQLRNICRWLKCALNLDKDLDRLNKKDCLTLVSFINRLGEKSDATRADYRRVLKQFYSWYKDEDERLFNKLEDQRIEARKLYRFLEKEVSSSCKQRQADPNTIITEDDIDSAVEKGARTHKEKAFLMLLHETGCRAGEFLNLKVGDIRIKENYAEIHVPDGKTGQRIVYVTKSVPRLIRYLEIHPYRESNNTYLWLSDSNYRLHKPLVHRGGQKLIDRCFKAAGVDKRHNWHWFRHSRATILAPHVTEAILCKYMGWRIGSKQVRVYVHLCTKQLQDVIMKLNGISTKEDQTDKPVLCVCGTLNNPRERYCFRCYKPLKMETAIQDQEIVKNETDKRLKVYAEIMADPVKRQQFEEFKKMFLGEEN